METIFFFLLNWGFFSENAYLLSESAWQILFVPAMILQSADYLVAFEPLWECRDKQICYIWQIQKWASTL